MRASIIIPLLVQRDEWLEQCLNSALSQTVSCEVLVIISPRTPKSNLDMLKHFQVRYPNLRVVIEKQGGGFSGAINCGIQRASTMRIGLLLSDDWLDPATVERCLELSGDIIATGINVYLEDGKTKVFERSMNLAAYANLPTLERKANYLTHFFLFNKQKLLEVGGLDEEIQLAGADDYDLIWTLLEQKATVSLVSTPLYNYRDHSGERFTLRNKAESLADLERILLKHGIHGKEKTLLMEGHSEWYGQPIHLTLRLSSSS